MSSVSEAGGPRALSRVRATDPAPSVDVSVVVPCFNERDNIDALYDRTAAELRRLGKSFETVLVDDGSTDGTRDKLEGIAARNANAKVIFLGRNSGQTAALMAGFDAATGDVIVPMDGDGQNDPADIEALLAKIDEGFDVVSGWRRQRQDPLLRSAASRVANHIISAASGVRLRDFGCTLKAYRRTILHDVRLYGEMHRFIPIFASWRGARVAEVAVRHHPRQHGVSNYGFERTAKVLLDLIIILFMDRYALKPFYVFGAFGFLNVFGSLAAGVLAVCLKVFAGISFVSTPLPLLVVLLFLVGSMSILMGLLAEMLMRTYYESQNKPPYVVSKTINL